MGARVGVGIRLAGRGPADPGSVLLGRQFRADVDHVPARAEPENQHGADEGRPIAEDPDDDRDPLLEPVQAHMDGRESAMGQHVAGFHRAAAGRRRVWCGAVRSSPARARRRACWAVPARAGP